MRRNTSAFVTQPFRKEASAEWQEGVTVLFPLDRCIQTLAATSAAVALMFGLAPAHAQDAAQDNVSEADEPVESGAPGVNVVELDEIIVTLPARDARTLQDTPAAVAVVGRDEIVRRQASTYQELLDDVPGLTIEGGPRGIGQEPNIRGFRDEQVVIRLDGARQNFNTAHRGRFFTDPDIVEQVEVVRSGSSALFGSGAIGGVIEVRTRSALDLLEPGQNYGVRLKTGYETNGEEIFGSGTLYGRYGAFDALLFTAIRELSENLEDGAGEFIVDSAIDSQNILGKIGFEPTDDIRLELNAQYYEDDGVTPNAADSITANTTLVSRDIGVQSYRLSFDYDPVESDVFDLTALVYYNDNSLEEDRVNVDAFDTTDFDTIGFEVTNRSNLDVGLPVRVSYGVEAYRDEQTGERELPGFIFPDASINFVGVFAQADIEITDTITITPGGRFDRFSLRSEDDFDDRSESQFSPRIAVTFEPSDNVTFWANYSQSFRAPSLTELYQDGVHFVVPAPFGPFAPDGVNTFVPTPDLEPEESNQVEIGMRARRRGLFREEDELKFEVNAYYNRVDNFIDTIVAVGPGLGTPIPGFIPFGTTTNVNVDAVLWGVEGEVRYDAGPWYVGLNGQMPRGRNVDGGGLGSVPQERISFLFGVRPLEGVELGGRLTHRGDQDQPPDVAGALVTRNSTVLDLFTVYSPQDGPFRGVTFAAGVDNVTDTTYTIHPNDVNQPGRSFKFSGSIQF